MLSLSLSISSALSLYIKGCSRHERHVSQKSIGTHRTSLFLSFGEEGMYVKLEGNYQCHISLSIALSLSLSLALFVKGCSGHE